MDAMALLPDFVLRGLIAGLAVAALCGPIGCFVVWRRMAYFGDTLAHSALLGVAAGLLLGVATDWTILAACLATAGALFLFRHDRRYSDDTLLGIFAHAALALGLVILGTMDRVRVDLFAYLFGDILAVGGEDLYWLIGGCALGGLVLWRLWRPLLAATVHADLAAAEGVPVVGVHLGFAALIALVVALGMKLVGVMLVTAMLIVPAAAARALARTPEQMGLLAVALGCLSVLGGFAAALRFDAPAGPAIVAVASLLFLVGSLGGRLLGTAGGRA